jgi:hypothetical protein
MATETKKKYHLLTGSFPVKSVEYENDDAAIAGAKGIEGVIRVQSDSTGKIIWEHPEVEPPSGPTTFALQPEKKQAKPVETAKTDDKKNPTPPAK